MLGESRGRTGSIPTCTYAANVAACFFRLSARILTLFSSEVKTSIMKIQLPPPTIDEYRLNNFFQ